MPEAKLLRAFFYHGEYRFKKLTNYDDNMTMALQNGDIGHSAV